MPPARTPLPQHVSARQRKGGIGRGRSASAPIARIPCVASEELTMAHTAVPRLHGHRPGLLLTLVHLQQRTPHSMRLLLADVQTRVRLPRLSLRPVPVLSATLPLPRAGMLMLTPMQARQDPRDSWRNCLVRVSPLRTESKTSSRVETAPACAPERSRSRRHPQLLGSHPIADPVVTLSSGGVGVGLGAGGRGVMIAGGIQ